MLLLLGLHPVDLLGARIAVGQAEPGGAGTPAEAEAERESGSTAVIPPGREELLAEMLGRGATLPGDCKFAGGNVERTFVAASYTCPQGEVVFELRYPGTGPAGATQTSRFAVALKQGAPPDGLADALVSRVRSHESTFEWQWTAATPGSSSRTTIILLAVAILLGLAGGGWVLSRRRRVSKP